MNESSPADAEAESGAGHVANESELLEDVGRCIESRRPGGRSLPILMIETGAIDGVDAVWGYQVGDAVRDRVCAALRSSVLRPEDPLGEIGRGKLACALTAVDDPSVALLAAEKSLRVMSTPFLIDEDDIYARPAIGIAMWPAHGDDAATLLQHALTATAIARTDPGHIAMFEPEQVNAGAAHFLYENRLRTAVAEDSLDLVFQPQYDLRLGNIMGLESLLRSRDPRIGLVPALDAYTAAESAGMVTTLVSSVLNRALRNCSEFRYSAGLDLRISVNLPARVLVHAELTDIVERALRTWTLRAGRLVFEIGETSVLEANASARDTLAKLNELGVRLAIDDPGLSVSSLFWLAAMPFKSLKIDVSGVAALKAEQQTTRIMQSLVELAHHLRLDVYAVGAEDAAAEARLKEIGCDFAQSDHRAPPLDAQEFVRQHGLDQES